ncbi:zinc finger MYM-type protein 5-like [Schistocerca serialis cubense]|uniref:zinc finger MYM-type protein 5-like n=1 Tax=Schistocerca serialis cubense TaxID=2023355 RepID=UPI00214EDFDA|nr:zinc finger MYM-type protein 5-like [Schistocerca serialis cubense]
MIKFLKKISGVTPPEACDEALIQMSLVSETEPASRSNKSVSLSDTASELGETAVIRDCEPNKDPKSDNQEQTVQIGESLIELDPGEWVFPVTDLQHHDLIQNGPHQNLEKPDESYPKDANKRHFTKFHFTRKLSNNKKQHHRWLAYSTSQDKVYCLPSQLFSHLQTQTVKEGFCNWKEMSRILQRHEQSQGHMECMIR